MKRIAIFCDGTWNRHDAKNPTNVVKLAQAVKHTADDGMTQQVFYFMGVGSGRGSNALARFTDRAMGGALGWGLIQNIEDAYRSLVFCYEPGDEIYIFGFSRGAYTARSLAGLIRSVGICPRENANRIGEAIDRYRTRNDTSTKPDDPASFHYRADFAPYTATSEKEWNWRQTTNPGMCVKLNVTFLGVWDTVGAMGVPGYWMTAPLLNKRHEFHDAALSRSVAAARHAVAVDERRKTFPAATWNNMDRLNRLALDLPDDADLGPTDVHDWPYREEWFPGDHGSVGGSGDRRGLSAYAFDWVARGAEKAGLDLRQEVMQDMASQRNYLEELRGTSKAGIGTWIMDLQSADRAGPDDMRKLASVTKQRIKTGHYVPGALKALIDKVMTSDE